eukprot:scaffold310_cov335-Pavlova_lutheri.AAC.78
MTAAKPTQGPLRGAPHPLGATTVRKTGTNHTTPHVEGVNFALHAPDARSVKLVLYRTSELLNQTRADHPEEPNQDGKGIDRGAQVWELDPKVNRSGGIWHAMLPQNLVQEDLCYAYLVDGHERPVLDPYAHGVVSRSTYGKPGPGGDCWPVAAGAMPNTALLSNPKSDGRDAKGLTQKDPAVENLDVHVTGDFDWEGDLPPGHHPADLVVYETHVRGFTQDSSANTEAPRGTFAALQEKLPFLAQLGINCLELMPVQEFNELEYYGPNPATGEARYNFWGYSTLSYYAPMARYAACAARGDHTYDGGRGASRELKELVKAAHRQGIEVLLDVVFNHTAEGNEMGPTLSFKGLDQRGFYMMAPMGEFYNYSGCGNTVNVNHPMTRRFILDCLRHWVTEYHVDGFRFDLGAILTRSSDKWIEAEVYGANQGEGGTESLPSIALGTPLETPPVLDLISNDGVLRSVKLVAEAWDCGGLYQVGSFPHFDAWAEWNGKFRDSVRAFIKGTDGSVGLFAGALCGSPELYEEGGRKPYHSINFVTAHDGFSLHDLVSYNEKHNNANGEENKDGDDHNMSWNCGVEGVPPEGVEEDVRLLRGRQMRNFLVALMVAQGVPMITMGDEYGHTKDGNNNTYCHDNALNWFLWDEMKGQQAGQVRFLRGLIRLRKRCPQLRLREFPNAEVLHWYGKNAEEPDWSETSRFVGFTLRGPKSHHLYIAFSPSHLPEFVTLPPSPGKPWKLVVDTARLPPFDFAGDDLMDKNMDFMDAGVRPYLVSGFYPMLPYSSVILETTN